MATARPAKQPNRNQKALLDKIYAGNKSATHAYASVGTVPNGDSNHSAADASDADSDATQDAESYRLFMGYDTGRTSRLDEFVGAQQIVAGQLLGDSEFAGHAPVYAPPPPPQQARSIARITPATMALNSASVVGEHEDTEGDERLAAHAQRIDKIEDDVKALQDATAKTRADVDVLNVKWNEAHGVLVNNVGELQQAREVSSKKITELGAIFHDLKRSYDDTRTDAVRLHKAESDIANTATELHGLKTRCDGLATKDELTQAIATLREAVPTVSLSASAAGPAVSAATIDESFVLPKPDVKKIKTGVTPLCRHRSSVYYHVTRGESLSVVVCSFCLENFLD